jgi:hypothetical protein
MAKEGRKRELYDMLCAANPDTEVVATALCNYFSTAQLEELCQFMGQEGVIPYTDEDGLAPEEEEEQEATIHERLFDAGGAE